MKKILAVVLALSLVFSAMAVMPTKAYAAENDADTSIAKKTSTAVDEDGRFQVEIQVPGGDGKEYHDEVIVMVDGSYSTDDDWSTTRNAILEIGKTVLEGSGNTLLTVMTFGMGDNVVLQHVASVAELDATLTQLPGGLLYGRSSTNCEAGFTGISEYIASHDGTLNEVHVVYITDGEINTDESTHVFYNWTQNTWLKKDAVTLAQWAIDEELALFTGGMTVLSNAYLTVFGDYSYTSEDSMLEEVVLQSEDDTEESTLEEPETEEVIPEEPETEEVIPEEPETEEVIPEEPETEEVILEEPETEQVIPEEPETEEVISEAALTAQVARVEKTLVSSAISEEETLNNLIISDEKAMQWAAQVWADVYEYSGMSPENAYTVSDVERAFVKYDKENNTHIQEMFYYALWGRTYPDRYTRTPVAGLALAAHENVAHLYMVDSNSATSWMASMANSAGNVSFYEAGSVSNLLTALEGVLTNLSYTPYNDVVVTDYMSKWVNLDKTSLKIVDNNLGKTIWTSAEGWLISENRPTAQEIPVVVEEVSSDAYAEGGSNVIGNENGTIYRITWYVKDGAMLRNHNYSLVYEVDVDTQENGFEYDTHYPANGNTTIDYTEKNGDENTEITENIAVPDVIVAKPEYETVTIQGNKTWEDEGNEDKRPGSITVRLMADGKEIASKNVTAADNWKYSFEDMPKYNETNNEIVYTVSEDEVSNYRTEVKGYDIINTYDVLEKVPESETDIKTETVTIQGTKTWMDKGNENKRPESITVRLMANGVEVASKNVTAADNWKYSFEDIPKYDESNNEIIYTVTEDAVPNYNTEVKGYDIVNTYNVPDKEPEDKEPNIPNSDSSNITKSEESNIPVQLIVPKTGDSNLMFFEVIIVIVSGIALIVLSKKKRKKNL